MANKKKDGRSKGWTPERIAKMKATRAANQKKDLVYGKRGSVPSELTNVRDAVLLLRQARGWLKGKTPDKAHLLALLALAILEGA